MKPKTHEDRLQQNIEAAEQLAYYLGLYATAKSLNSAKNKCGWERAKKLLRAKP